MHDCYKCRADCIVSHDKVPLTLSLDPVSESSLCLLLIDEHLRNGASTRRLGENDGLLFGMTVNSPTERVAASHCLLTTVRALSDNPPTHIWLSMSFRSRLYDRKTCFWRVWKSSQNYWEKDKSKILFWFIIAHQSCDNRLIRMAKLWIEKANRLLLLKRVFNKDVPLSLWWTPLL